MGRITIFCANGCSHAKRAKSAFDRHGIDYSIINVSDYPERLVDMISLSQQFSSPQVFFNSQLIGGADETIELIDRWSKKSKSRDLAAKFRKEISILKDPTDPRLALPDHPPVRPDQGPQQKTQYFKLEGALCLTTFELMERLRREVDRTDMGRGMKLYKHAFKGSTLFQTLCGNFRLTTDQGRKMATKLLEQQIVLPIEHKSALFDTNALYRLHCCHTPHVLNSYRAWNEECDTHSMRLVQRLVREMDYIFSSFLSFCLLGPLT